MAGGIPIIRSLREGLAANRILRVSGILNGTCNFILTTMRETGREFADVLAGGAGGSATPRPTPPSTSTASMPRTSWRCWRPLAFGGRPRFDAIHIEGIRHVSAIDIAFADQLGYRIKLLGVARMTEQGLEQRLHPCMVPVNAPIAQVEGVYNAVVVEGDQVGAVMHEGRGAGAGPTASAVVGDLIELARGLEVPTFGVPAAQLRDHPIAPMAAHEGSYYIRLMVLDEPGVLADISAVLRDHEVSIESLIQRGRNPGQAVPIVLTSHDTTEARMSGALERIATLPAVIEPPRMIRIERS